jgi:hypothetical protein
VYNGVTYASLSGAGNAVTAPVSGLLNVDGWKFWRIRLHDALVPLLDMRRRFAEQQAAGPATH